MQLALIQSFLQIADGFFLGPIVAGPVRRIVEREDIPFGQEVIDRLAVERRAIIPLAEQGRAVFFEELSQVSGDFMALLFFYDQGWEAITGGEIGDSDNLFTVGAIFLPNFHIAPNPAAALLALKTRWLVRNSARPEIAVFPATPQLD